MARFARVTEFGKGEVQWVNLEHVRQIVELKGVADQPVRTAVHIDNSWVERVLHVRETPEQILSQVEAR
ncbi:MAG: hypothetical protein ACK4Z5_12215 [Brevundimonas sp.]